MWRHEKSLRAVSSSKAGFGSDPEVKDLNHFEVALLDSYVKARAVVQSRLVEQVDTPLTD